MAAKSGRFDSLHETAEAYAFAIDQLGGEIGQPV
jgi:protease II